MQEEKMGTLKWTNKAPTKPGWYWRTTNKGATMYVQQVTYSEGVLVAVQVSGDKRSYLDVSHSIGEWYGPIDAPNQSTSLDTKNSLPSSPSSPLPQEVRHLMGQLAYERWAHKVVSMEVGRLRHELALKEEQIRKAYDEITRQDIGDALARLSRAMSNQWVRYIDLPDGNEILLDSLQPITYEEMMQYMISSQSINYDDLVVLLHRAGIRIQQDHEALKECVSENRSDGVTE